VDAADLTDWRDSFGVDGGADSDGDGDSDGADFLVWQRNLGQGTPGVGAAAGVPEPTSVVLVGLAAAWLAGVRRNRRIG
jgi:hypothetical protein